VHGEGVVAAGASERDRLADDVVGGEEQIGQPAAPQALEDGAYPLVVPVVRREQREEEARVDEYHL